MKDRFKYCFLSLLFCCTAWTSHAKYLESSSSSAIEDHHGARWGFLENQGQWPDDALFRGAASGFSVKFQLDGVLFMSARESDNHRMEGKDGLEGDHGGWVAKTFLSEREEEEHELYVWKMQFAGGNPTPKVDKGNVVAARTNFFIGDDPGQWKTKVPEYDEVIYREVWEGIDARFFLTEGGALKYEFLLAPGADPEDIRIEFEGLNGIEVLESGELRLNHPWGPVTEDVPVAFTAETRRDVPVNFLQMDDRSYGFQVDDMPEGEAWVIDPLIVYWSSFTNPSSSGLHYSYDVAHDSTGSLYITGGTGSSFPSTPGAYQTTFGGFSYDAYVAKFSPDGSNLMFMTYLGGNGNERAFSIEVNDSGRVFLGGGSLSSNFPVTPGAISANFSTTISSWVACLSSDGTSLLYSTFLCGTCDSEVASLATVSGNEVIVAGNNDPLNGAFPITPFTYQPFPPGGTLDGFVCRLNATGSALIWSTNLGGSGLDFIGDIAVNDLEEPYIVGYTESIDYPITPGSFQASTQGNGFITRLNAAGNGAIYSSWYGSISATVNVVAVHPTSREAFIAGGTFGATGTIVTTPGAFQPNNAGSNDATVARINAAGSSLIYSTYLGGSAAEVATDIAVNSQSEVYVTGITNSFDLPVTACTFQSAEGGDDDAFIAHLSPLGTNPGVGGITYLGGFDDDYTTPSVKIDEAPGGDTLFVSLTTHSLNFPVTPGAFETTKLNGPNDTQVALKFVVYQPNFVNLPDSNDCNLDSIQMSIPFLADSIRWSTGDTNPSVWFAQSGTYWVNVYQNNCTFSDTFTLGIPSLSVDLGTDTSFCDNVSLFLPLSAGTGNSWIWSTSDTTASISVTAPGTYWVEVTDTLSGCTTTDTVIVQSLPSPVVNLSPTPFCQGDSTQLNADPANAYPGAGILWSTSETTTQIWVGGNGWVWVDLTLPNGCITRDSVLIVSNPLPTPNLGQNQVLCDQATFFSDAGPGFANYLWSDNSTGQTAIFTQPGWVWVEVTDTNGCINRDSIQLLPGISPVPQLGADTLLCEGLPLSLDPQVSGSGYTYLWNDGSTSNTLPVNSDGTYWVEVTDSNGCFGRDTVQVGFFPAPNLSLPADTLVCDQDSLLLIVGTFASYQWSDGSTDPELFVSQAGDYSVTVSNGSICLDSAVIRVGFDRRPVPDLGPDLELCRTDQGLLTISPPPGTTIRWSNGSTDNVIEPLVTGDYWIEMENVCGTASDTVRVTFQQELTEPLLPNVFSPNGDGINDCFRVENPRTETFFVQVFDRWGQMVFETRNPTDCWDGLFRDAPTPEGVYYYIARIRACNGELVTESVNLTLVR